MDFRNECSNITGNKFSKEVIPIPDWKVGWLIGKNGVYITQLSLDTNTRLRIIRKTSMEFGRNWKYLEIIGTSRNIDSVKKMVHIRMEELQYNNKDNIGIKIKNYNRIDVNRNVYSIEPYYNDHSMTNHLSI